MKPALVITCAAAVLAIAACQSRSTAPDPPAQAVAPQTVVIDPSMSPISAAAEREVIRRQEAMRRADEAFLRGSRQMADGDYEGAMDASRGAVGALPR